ncbi:MAG: MGMT family protein [Clostridiales Family XIII bacterium]|jgi:methylated-DNA-protein-cysteine methyltransferase-like protein|nr:MGMT family protein [Clostridiales Family XIII bacterium]
MRTDGDFFGQAMRKGQKTFFERVYDTIARVPYGRVVSYGQIARVLGNPRAARSVGWACAACPDHLPWQRVVRADGSVAGGAFADMRRALLASEGVSFLPDGRVDMDACRIPDALLLTACQAPP